MDDFPSQVVELVYRSAKVRLEPYLGSQVPDFFDTLNDAIVEFYRKYSQNPDLFASTQDAANWVFKVVGNMKRWANLDTALPLDDLEPFLEAPAEPATAHQEPADWLGAASVIQQYFANPKARHQGRLTLTTEEVKVIQAAANYSLSDTGSIISSANYQLISEILDASVDYIQRTLYKSRAAFAEIFYVVGALGPTDAFDSAEKLDSALVDFWANFTGQNDWSILKFAARSSLPKKDHARVDPDLYTQAIETEYHLGSGKQPNQAARLGWQPGGATPPSLLHAVEARAAQAFANPHPRCVFCGCKLHTPGDEL